MSMLTYWHNPRCTKSREGLAVLREKGIEPEVREYLKDVPHAEELKAVASKLGVDSARELVVAAFKGSNDTADWVQDFSGGEFDFSSCALPSGESVGTVHAGFCEYYVDIAELGLVADFVALAQAHPTVGVLWPLRWPRDTDGRRPCRCRRRRLDDERRRPRDPDPTTCEVSKIC